MCCLLQRQEHHKRPGRVSSCIRCVRYTSLFPRGNYSADAMARLYDKYADDLDVAALYSESLMALNPWAMWVRKDVEATGEAEIVPVNGSTLIVKDVLERVSCVRGKFVIATAGKTFWWCFSIFFLLFHDLNSLFRVLRLSKPVLLWLGNGITGGHGTSRHPAPLLPSHGALRRSDCGDAGGGYPPEQLSTRWPPHPHGLSYRHLGRALQGGKNRRISCCLHVFLYGLRFVSEWCHVSICLSGVSPSFHPVDSTQQCATQQVGVFSHLSY